MILYLTKNNGEKVIVQGWTDIIPITKTKRENNPKCNSIILYPQFDDNGNPSIYVQETVKEIYQQIEDKSFYRTVYSIEQLLRQLVQRRGIH